MYCHQNRSEPRNSKLEDAEDTWVRTGTLDQGRTYYLAKSTVVGFQFKTSGF